MAYEAAEPEEFAYNYDPKQDNDVKKQKNKVKKKMYLKNLKNNLKNVLKNLKSIFFMINLKKNF